MTNKPTIDGVSRDTATIALRLIARELEMLANDSAIQRHKAALSEIRAFLAAPVVEPKAEAVAWFRSDALGCVAWKPRASVFLNEGDALYAQPTATVDYMRFEYAHPTNQDRYTVSVSRADVLEWASEELFQRLTAMHCQCEPIGETNVDDCRCDEYSEEFELVANDGATPAPECTTCGGKRVVPDGELTCSEGGVPFENGPIECVKDCPECASTPAPTPAAVVLPSREELRDVIAETIGGDAYDCIRVWNAWAEGTMTQDDFIPIVDDENRLYEIADACLSKVKEANQ